LVSRIDVLPTTRSAERSFARDFGLGLGLGLNTEAHEPIIFTVVKY